MLNAEYWRDRIDVLNGDRIAVENDFPICCGKCDCQKCDLRNGPANSCTYNFVSWLIKEHKDSDIEWEKVPPETPVRVWDDDGDDTEVCDRDFMCYLPNRKQKFWTFLSPGRRDMAVAWEHCRLVRQEDNEKYRRKNDDKS